MSNELAVVPNWTQNELLIFRQGARNSFYKYIKDNFNNPSFRIPTELSIMFNNSAGLENFIEDIIDSNNLSRFVQPTTYTYSGKVILWEWRKRPKELSKISKHYSSVNVRHRRTVMVNIELPACIIREPFLTYLRSMPQIISDNPSHGYIGRSYSTPGTVKELVDYNSIIDQEEVIRPLKQFLSKGAILLHVHKTAHQKHYAIQYSGNAAEILIRHHIEVRLLPGKYSEGKHIAFYITNKDGKYYYTPSELVTFIQLLKMRFDTISNKTVSFNDYIDFQVDRMIKITENPDCLMKTRHDKRLE